MATPSVKALQQVAAALQAAGVEVALGGSGLLYALGLAGSVRDWDLTTDAPWEQVEPALSGFDWSQAPCGDGPYRSRFRVSVRVGAAEIDLIGRFAVGEVHLPTIPSGEWQGVPTGAPEVWAVAYRLIERHAKADSLSAYIHDRGPQLHVVPMLMVAPLPQPLLEQVRAWNIHVS